MKVLVLGSGVVGVTSAWYLAQAGHEVVVVDRQPGPALETSFANAGEISPGYSSPWAGPGVPLKAIKWMLMHFGPLVVRPKFDPYMALWLVRMLRNCTSARYARNKIRMVPIAEYSRDSLRDLRAETGIAYDERSQDADDAIINDETAKWESKTARLKALRLAKEAEEEAENALKPAKKPARAKAKVTLATKGK